MTNSLPIVITIANIIITTLNGILWYSLYTKDRKITRRQKNFFHQYNSLIQAAHKKASQLILNATQKSSELLSNTQILTEDIRKQYSNNLSQAQHRQTQLFEQQLINLQQEHQKLLTQLSSSFTQESENLKSQLFDQAKAQIDNFIKDLSQQASSVPQQLQDQLKKDISQVEIQVQTYRDQQFKLVDQQINQVITNIINQVFPSAISPEDHQQLILQALEKAKKDGIFKS